ISAIDGESNTQSRSDRACTGSARSFLGSGTPPAQARHFGPLNRIHAARTQRGRRRKQVMGGIKRIVGIAFIWVIAAIGWMILGGVTERRSETTQTKLRDGVQSLWGSPQAQQAPQLTFSWETKERIQRTEEKNGVQSQVTEVATV